MGSFFALSPTKVGLALVSVQVSKELGLLSNPTANSPCVSFSADLATCMTGGRVPGRIIAMCATLYLPGCLPARMFNAVGLVAIRVSLRGDSRFVCSVPTHTLAYSGGGCPVDIHQAQCHHTLH